VEARRRTKRQLREERYRLRDRSEYRWDGVVGIHRATLDSFASAIEKGGWDREELFRLRVRGEQLAAVNDFDELLAVDLAKVEHMPHQEATALKVLRQMRGRAILADEVGLGKTIEAGLVMKELVLRGMARRILVLCPASLREQWRGELHEKFDEAFEVVMSGSPIRGDRIIMSVDLARLNIPRVTADAWDLVIVDEAHKGINGPATRRLIGELDTRFLLFLTATPVQNRLTELYNLVELLRPGTFRSQRDFENRYVDRNDPRRPVDAAGLRKLVSDVMVRTTREQVGIDKIRRYAVDVPIPLSPPERQMYDLCTVGLRSVMTDSGDHLRRRNLAHRLTASPRSLAMTARKVATTHPAPRVREFLTELSDLAIGFGLTSRQQRLLGVLDDWLSDAEKGRALVFTQHADTLDDLLRILTDQDIDAVPFHGGMSASARQRSIEKFRDGVPVMVATDAGAEGLNLQFANCVVNYDLPWNPMRIEQRIGRVHRLTQKRDVHVANFFAENTVDEHVYRLLHDKLRMFELLFGQVTTILGELEVRNSQTFEGQILDAYLAKTDQEMQRRLVDLGTRVDKAYENAQDMMRDRGGLNSWVVDRSYRDEIRRGGAEELRPLVEQRARQRQEQVQEFVREYLQLTGAEITTDAADELFLTARLSPGLAEHFDGREELHLAFTPGALERHRDAELCAVGSDIFEEIVLSLRELGDLHATMPAVAVPQEPWLDHDEDLTLLTRDAIGPAEWSGRAMWRTHCDANDLGDDVLVVDIGEPDKMRPKQHRDLAESDPLPESLGTPADLLERVALASKHQLEEIAGLAQEEIDQRLEQERERVLGNAERQLEELKRVAWSYGQQRERARTDLDRITRLQEHYEAMKPATAEVRADLLALDLVGSSALRLRETWRSSAGVEFALETTWTPRSRANVAYTDAQGRPILHLALCREGHPVDRSRCRTCPGCDETSCDLCGPNATFAACPACGVEQCAACRSTGLGVCRQCGDAQRAPELDAFGQRGWRLGFGATLVVGERVVSLRRPNDHAATILVPAEGEDASTRERLRGVAASLDVRLDLGAYLIPLTSAPELPEHALELVTEPIARWTVDPRRGSRVEPDAVAHLPAVDGPTVSDLGVSGLEELVDRLAAADAPLEAPALAVREGVQRTYLEPRDDGIWLVERTDIVGREPQIVGTHVDLVADTPSGAQASVGTYAVRVRRLHRSLLLEVDDSDGDGVTFFVPGAPGVTEESERLAARLVEQHHLPATAQLSSNRLAPLPAQFAEPRHVVLIDRNVAPVWIAEPGAGDGPFGPDDVASLGVDPPHGWAQRVDHDAFEGLRRQFAETVPAGPAFHLTRHARVTETWLDASRETRSRVVPPEEPAFPILDDTGAPAADFRIDWWGHFYERDHGWECLACERVRCRACGDDGVLSPCDDCGQAACGSCRGREPTIVADEDCNLCGARSCGACGRTLGAQRCGICERSACRRCWRGHRCVGCDSLTELTADEVTALPAELVATGLTVLGHRVADITVVALAGRARREFAVIKSGAIERWWTLRAAVLDERRLRMAVARRYPEVGGDIGVVLDDRSSTKMPDVDAVILADAVASVVGWELRHDGGVIARSSEPVNLAPEVDALSAVVAALGADGLAVPDPAPAARRALLQSVVPVSDGAPAATIRVTRADARERVEVDGAGLHVRQAGSLTAGTTVRGWQEGPGRGRALVDAWPLQPDHVLSAERRDFAALLARFGSSALLAWSTGDGWTVTRIDDEPSFPSIAALADALGFERDTLEITAVTLANEAPGIVVKGAEQSAAGVSPVWRDEHGASDETAREAAFLQWLDVASLAPLATTPPAPVSNALRASLKKTAGVGPGRSRRGAVGVRRRETWVAGDLERLVEYDIFPGEVGRVTADDTGTESTTVHFDRAGHLAADPAECPYCAAVTCAHCEDGAKACELCGISVCGRCRGANEAWLCPACASLEPLGRLRSLVRRHVHGRALVGSDDVHSVTFVAGSSGVYLLTARGDVEADPEHLQLTDRQVALLNAAARAELF
jgi:hypothetical protein